MAAFGIRRPASYGGLSGTYRAKHLRTRARAEKAQRSGYLWGGSDSNRWGKAAFEANSTGR